MVTFSFLLLKMIRKIRLQKNIFKVSSWCKRVNPFPEFKRRESFGERGKRKGSGILVAIFGIEQMVAMLHCEHLVASNAVNWSPIRNLVLIVLITYSFFCSLIGPNLFRNNATSEYDL